ncbi:MAG: tRNA (guanosine(37)-N1)-methyltransferase TrmD [Acidimicrobiia bacterium]|nr:tRNA (guanosine(37)-N1)-methyltransferase TrmD [Acidimicrobiia bacterium]MDH3397341.1 tRNA (guanosine(37)-N1)-methyltransferase TrmD [Acidimicrobiia bacterium]
MKISIVTLFVEFFASPLKVSVVGRAQEAGLLEVSLIDLRTFSQGAYRQVDDAPFGGGPGMVLMVEPLAAALESVGDSHKVLFTPAGSRLDQPTLDRWATEPHVTFVCGRYEGVDERVAEHLVNEQVSLGDFVLAGGESAALAAVEGVARLLPGVLGNPQSTGSESFRAGLLEEPHYTRPAEFRGWRVPDVLLSGDHGKLEAWRQEQRLRRTQERRPDLLSDDHQEID